MKPQSIVILGAGVAGLHCARVLARRLPADQLAEISLIDIGTHHYLHLELYSLLNVKLTRRRLGVPTKTAIHGRSIRLIHDLVVSFDPVNQSVTLHDHGRLNYDYLVVALGSKPTDFKIPGLTDNAYWFASVEDALRLRQTLIKAWQHQPHFHLVIGGGGVAGSELAGSIIDMVSAMANEWSRPDNRWQFSLIEAAGHILPGQTHRLVKAAHHYIKSNGFDIYTNQPIKRVTASQIRLANKRTIAYDCFIWTGGMKAHPIVKAAGLETDSSGRAIVNPFLQARGFSRVYVLGDCASFATGRHQALPRLAWHALFEGHQAARNIVCQLRGRPLTPFQPKESPMIITLGQISFFSYGHWWLAGRLITKARDLAAWWYYTDLEPLETALLIGQPKPA